MPLFFWWQVLFVSDCMQNTGMPTAFCMSKISTVGQKVKVERRECSAIYTEAIDIGCSVGALAFSLCKNKLSTFSFLLIEYF